MERQVSVSQMLTKKERRDECSRMLEGYDPETN